MIADLKPYPVMKDSGVDWLGKVPEHWDVRKLRGALRLTTERNRPELPLLSVVREKGIVLRDVTNKDENHNYIPDDLTNYKVVQRGHFAINKMKAWQGSYGVSKFDGIVSPAYFVFNVDGVDGDFFQIAIRSQAYVPYFTQASDGVRIGQWDLSLARLREIPFSVPPLPEQAAVVRYLDYVDRRIQRNIRAKQKLIALLEEQKQAVIHQAVTGQVDVRTGRPYPAYKPSGVEWLGKVPEHWEVVRFKRRVGFQEGPGIMAADFRDEGVPLLRVSCLRSETATLEGCNFLDPEMVQSRWGHFAVCPGDYLLSASASTGRVVLATEVVANAIPYTGILRLWAVTKNTFMPFVQFYMRCHPFQEQIDAAKSGVAIEHFGPTHLQRMYIVLPAIREQQRIVAVVEQKTAPFAKTIRHAQRTISLLREYRNRLIADVVTGQLDVREAAALLPDEAEEPHDEDEEQSKPVDDDVARSASLH